MFIFTKKYKKNIILQKQCLAPYKKIPFYITFNSKIPFFLNGNQIYLNKTNNTIT